MQTETDKETEREADKATENLHFSVFESPIGKLHLAVSENGVRTISFGQISGADASSAADISGKAEATEATEAAGKIMKQLKTELEEYFSGSREKWDVPIDWEEDTDQEGGNFYQKARRVCLEEVDYGKTISYRGLAQRLSSPRAPRAVGTAMATNPIPIIVPCHRVIAADGTIGKYGGGKDAKRWLLNMEAGPGGRHF